MTSPSDSQPDQPDQPSQPDQRPAPDPQGPADAWPGDGERHRYAVVGLGHRASMYVGAILGEHADVAELVAWCEPDPSRVAVYDAVAAEHGVTGVPAYGPDDLETMLDAERVDTVIITAPGNLHADLVARVLRAGAHVVVEKPLTITAEGCRTIAAAIEETGHSVVMAFSDRYAPRNSELRRVIAGGEIGEVTSVRVERVLDTVHGADRSRRLHRGKALSGDLLVHTASHHVDLVNWWIADAPDRVSARRGIKVSGDQDQDQDVFSPGVIIEDDLVVLVDYRRGASLTYALAVHGPWEGYRVTVDGTKGRAELEVVERGSVELDEGGRPILDPSAVAGARGDDGVPPPVHSLVVQDRSGRARRVAIPDGAGGHGGADKTLLRDVFRGPVDGPRFDPLGRPAGFVDGVRAVAVGIAGSASLLSGMPVVVDDLELGVDIEVRTRLAVRTSSPVNPEPIA